MRTFAVAKITAAAVAAGIAEDNVMMKPDRSSTLDPVPRMELEYLDSR